MKKKILFLIFFAFKLGVHGQPVIKIFAFEQESVAGTIPAGVKDENGNPAQKAAARKNYFIFLSFKRTSPVIPVQVFIKGKPYSVQAILSRKSPVEYSDNMIPGKPEKKVLVPKTNNKVIEVRLAEETSQKKKTSYVQRLIKANDVVISWLWNKKKYFTVLKKIKALDPLMNE